jgi:LPS sulfotransferase NodH
MLFTERVLEPLKRTLLPSLQGADRLVFVGDRRTIAVLRAFYEGAGSAPGSRFVEFTDAPGTDWKAILDGRCVVVASVRHEAALTEQVRRLASTHAVSTPILRLFGDLFVNLACGQDPLQPSVEAPHVPPVAYAIVGTPRCGTEFLCDALTSTGAAGFPEEHLRLESQLLTRHGRFDCVAYFRALRSRRVTPNGVFGTKIISHFLFDHLRWAPKLHRELTSLRYIHIVRRDRIGQAISAMVASKTGVWHLRNDAERARYADLLAGLTIDARSLRHVRFLIGGFERQDRRLTAFLKKLGAPTLTVTYEDLVENPASELLSILSFLTLQVPAGDISVKLKTTRSPFSDMVRAKYIERYEGESKLAALLRKWRGRPG